ncbi:UDP-glucose dehydrogenase family protein [Priestia megaterium]|uniref:UDP-glucose dehydrogenase family protein n=1 Tax=Priestia megaterium TaxID=1404 RepID=UPI00263AD3F5|nr:UDP-glucose/GDP-mannose dehydrogenase family protein [Priestia megaterium]MDN4866197.1 UDP-glucose/GDP-mannose dehydrogenase family protein [Priestia megaterium]
MDIAIIGTGYVGLVTGTCLSEIGHNVTCIEIDEEKVKELRLGNSPIYEPGLGELITNNIQKERLNFTASHKEGLANKQIIYIAVGTPQEVDGSANLRFIEQAAKDIAQNITNDVIVVTKSTVPVGTNMYIKDLILNNLKNKLKVEIISNPEFLREGSAIKDTFHGDRIIIGHDNEKAACILEEVYKPLDIPIFKTDIYSAEMIKYASNTFLATKISFINEIANICDKVGANIEEVAKGMKLDKRIGPHFLNAGIGYGGSCFPKDNSALIKIAENVQYDLEIIKSTIKVNEKQPSLLVEKAKTRFGNLIDKRIALLGLTFKPYTDDMREAPSIYISKQLLKEGAQIIAYDPVGVENAKEVFPQGINYIDSVEQALLEADLVFILTEWKEITESFLKKATQLMKDPVIFDGRNCFSLKDAKSSNVEYHSIGRPTVLREMYGEFQ